MSASTLGTLVHEFFMNHLEQKGVRRSSVRSYRDTGSRMGERPKSDSARGVPLCGCQRYFGRRWAVERPITQHGE